MRIRNRSPSPGVVGCSSSLVAPVAAADCQTTGHRHGVAMRRLLSPFRVFIACALVVATPVSPLQPDTAPRRVTIQQDPPGSAHSYRFDSADSKGRPVTWRPCSRVAIVLNPVGAPSWAEAALRGAIADVRARSGVRLSYAGRSTAVPKANWGQAGHLSDGYWRPVLVAWVEASSPHLVPGSSATTTSVMTRTAEGLTRRVAGLITVNREHNPLYPTSAQVGWSLRLLLQHELGHLVGLDHVADPTQLMYPQAGHTRGWGAGDLSGLRKLGSTRCDVSEG
jgi:hypothetical protein